MTESRHEKAKTKALIKCAEVVLLICAIAGFAPEIFITQSFLIFKLQVIVCGGTDRLSSRTWSETMKRLSRDDANSDSRQLLLSVD